MTGFHKILCPFCNGPVEFEVKDAGELAPCPHCTQEIVLEKTIEARLPRQEAKPQFTRKLKEPAKSMIYAAIAILVTLLACFAAYDPNSRLGQLGNAIFLVVGPLALLFLILMIYFAPTIVASQKSHRNTTAILVLNFLLGWTLLGWALALVWAVYKERETKS